MTILKTVGDLITALSAFPQDAEIAVDGMAGDLILVAVSRSYYDGQQVNDVPGGPVILEVIPADGFEKYTESLNLQVSWLSNSFSIPCWCNDPNDESRTHSKNSCQRK